MTGLVNFDFSIDEDALIQGLLDAKGKKVELIAFGIVYAGKLEECDIDSGFVTIADGEDRAIIEVERIESLSIVV